VNATTFPTWEAFASETILVALEPKFKDWVGVAALKALMTF